MAHSLSAKKRIRQALKRQARNRWRMRTLRVSLKTFEEKMLHASYDEAQAAYRDACKILDRTASKGVLHKNTAARKKSRLNKRLKHKHQSAKA
ncbi:MAG: 30S ribosomal protein S20 [Phycisphaeraceae bacterium]|nr:MAG: 30S ribosomal protein S20 [Phycisphaeraceae bacterium]